MRMNRFSKIEKSWIMYDWANSVYATIVMAAVFPIYFTSVAKATGFAGDVWWGYTSSISSFLIALSAPFLGAIGDFRGMKKRLLTIFMLIGIAFTFLMAVTDRLILMLVGYGVSFIGFSGANLFYDSFLTDVTTPERMDRVSSYGFAMGYFGGSTIPFLISIGLMLFGGRVGIDTVLAVKISVLLTCVWWAVFSIPILKNVRQTHYVDTPPGMLVRGGLANLRRTVLEIIRNKKLLFFIIAYFFYIDGVGTVITMSTSYGSTLGLGSTGMILALLLTQILAVPFSILFGRLAEKIGSHRMIRYGILMYILICFVGFYMGFSLEPSQKAYTAQYQAAVESARGTLDAKTVGRIRTGGAAVLSSTDRVAAFHKLIAAEYAGADAGKKASLDRLGSAVDAFLADDGKAAGFRAALSRSTVLFWILAVLVSTSQGGIQAISRSFFGKLIPPERSNENFGFFDIFGKFADVMGPALYAFFAAATGRSSVGILSLLLLFAAGYFFLSLSSRHFKTAASAG